MYMFLRSTGLCALALAFVSLSGCDSANEPTTASVHTLTPTSARGIQPVTGPFPGGDPTRTCKGDGRTALKVDSPRTGTTTLNGIVVTISPDGKFLSFTSTFAVDFINVKGGTLQNTYTYANFVGPDSGLRSPLTNGGQIPQISNYTVCLHRK